MIKQTVSIVIPGFDEAKRLDTSVNAMIAFSRDFHARQSQYELEIIYSLELSSDGSAELCRSLCKDEPHFIVYENDVQKGKGYAVKTGMLHANGDFVFFMDLDLSTSLSHIEEFLKYFELHPEMDILIGDRKNPKTKINKNQSLLRRKLGEIFNFFVQTFVFRGIHDTQCGFKAFRKDVSYTLFSQLTRDGFSFDVELLEMAKKLNYKVRSMYVIWTNDDESKVSILRDSFDMLLDIILLRTKLRGRKLVKIDQKKS